MRIHSLKFFLLFCLLFFMSTLLATGKVLAIQASEIAVDSDGDGDADDDQQRNPGRSARPAWTSELSGGPRTEVALISAADPAMHARVKTRNRGDDSAFELKLVNGEPDTTYTVVAWFDTEEVGISSFVTDQRGKANLQLEGAGTLDPLIPSGLGLADMTEVALYTDGELVMSGTI